MQLFCLFLANGIDVLASVRAAGLRLAPQLTLTLAQRISKKAHTHERYAREILAPIPNSINSLSYCGCLGLDSRLELVSEAWEAFVTDPLVVQRNAGA